MVDAGALLKFPGGKNSGPKKAVHEQAPLPVMDSYDYEETVELYQIAIAVKKKAEDLVKVADDNRVSIRQAGIGIVAVQVSSILEGDRFQMIMDALEDAVYRRVPVTLSREGVDKIHRLEKLIAEADYVVVSLINRQGGNNASLSQTAPSYQAIPHAVALDNSTDVSRWMPAIIVGVAGIVAIIAILALTQQPRRR
jgi:hypothetical protein